MHSCKSNGSNQHNEGCKPCEGGESNSDEYQCNEDDENKEGKEKKGVIEYESDFEDITEDIEETIEEDIQDLVDSGRDDENIIINKFLNITQLENAGVESIKNDTDFARETELEKNTESPVTTDEEVSRIDK